MHQADIFEEPSGRVVSLPLRGEVWCLETPQAWTLGRRGDLVEVTRVNSWGVGYQYQHDGHKGIARHSDFVHTFKRMGA